MNVIIYIHIFHFSSPGHVEEKLMELPWHSLRFHLTTKMDPCQRPIYVLCNSILSNVSIKTEVYELTIWSQLNPNDDWRNISYKHPIKLHIRVPRKGGLIELPRNCWNLVHWKRQRSTKVASAGSIDKRLDPTWSSWHDPRYLAECY
jgi:hypothetical protein